VQFANTNDNNFIANIHFFYLKFDTSINIFYSVTNYIFRCPFLCTSILSICISLLVCPSFSHFYTSNYVVISIFPSFCPFFSILFSFVCVFIFIYLSVCLSFSLALYGFNHIFFLLSLCLSVCQSLFVCLFVRLCLSFSVCQFEVLLFHFVFFLSGPILPSIFLTSGQSCGNEKKIKNFEFQFVSLKMRCGSKNKHFLIEINKTFRPRKPFQKITYMTMTVHFL